MDVYIEEWIKARASEKTPRWQLGLDLCFDGSPAYMIGARMRSGRHNLILQPFCARMKVRTGNAI